MLVTLALQFTPIDPYLAIPARFWLGSLLGGCFFAAGMTIAGGCATGLLWRSAEGGIKIWLGLLCFAWSGSVFSALGRQWGWLQESMSVELVKVSALGRQLFLPDSLGGWLGAIVIMFGWLVCWYALLCYTRRSNRPGH